jgi:hypothetical protein
MNNFGRHCIYILYVAISIDFDIGKRRDIKVILRENSLGHLISKFYVERAQFPERADFVS